MRPQKMCVLSFAFRMKYKNGCSARNSGTKQRSSSSKAIFKNNFIQISIQLPKRMNIKCEMAMKANKIQNILNENLRIRIYRKTFETNQKWINNSEIFLFKPFKIFLFICCFVFFLCFHSQKNKLSFQTRYSESVMAQSESNVYLLLCVLQLA